VKLLLNHPCVDVLQALYDSEINWKLECFWDSGFQWALGSEYAGFIATGTENTRAEAVTALTTAALKHYPRSEFAKLIDRQTQYRVSPCDHLNRQRHTDDSENPDFSCADCGYGT
jgi:hypothetical protein